MKSTIIFLVLTATSTGVDAASSMSASDLATCTALFNDYPFAAAKAKAAVDIISLNSGASFADSTAAMKECSDKVPKQMQLEVVATLALTTLEECRVKVAGYVKQIAQCYHVAEKAVTGGGCGIKVGGVVRMGRR